MYAALPAVLVVVQQYVGGRPPPCCAFRAEDIMYHTSHIIHLHGEPEREPCTAGEPDVTPFVELTEREKQKQDCIALHGIIALHCIAHVQNREQSTEQNSKPTVMSKVAIAAGHEATELAAFEGYDRTRSTCDVEPKPKSQIEAFHLSYVYVVLSS